MASESKTLVTLATYNEIENLPRLLEEIWHCAPDVDVLVVDDNSPDGTGKWCDCRREEEPRLDCLHRKGKLGLGSAIIAGMRHGIDRGYDFVINMDADFSHHPQHLPALRARAESADEPLDVAIGSRYVRGGKIEGWPFYRYVMSRGVNLYARWLLWLAPRDCSGSYRCYRVSLLEKLDFDAFTAQGYAFQEEVLWRLKRLGARIGEVPITFVNRTEGTSKIDSREALSAFRVILRLGLANIFSRSAGKKRSSEVRMGARSGF